MELVSAYVPFANGGIAVAPHVIDKVSTAGGKLIYKARNPGLELRFADHRLGIAVDQPTNTAPQLIELALDGVQLGPTRSSAQLLQASLVLLG